MGHTGSVILSNHFGTNEHHAMLAKAGCSAHGQNSAACTHAHPQHARMMPCMRDPATCHCGLLLVTWTLRNLLFFERRTKKPSSPLRLPASISHGCCWTMQHWTLIRLTPGEFPRSARHSSPPECVSGRKMCPDFLCLECCGKARLPGRGEEQLIKGTQLFVKIPVGTVNVGFPSLGDVHWESYRMVEVGEGGLAN